MLENGQKIKSPFNAVVISNLDISVLFEFLCIFYRSSTSGVRNKTLNTGIGCISSKNHTAMLNNCHWIFSWKGKNSKLLNKNASHNMAIVGEPGVLLSNVVFPSIFHSIPFHLISFFSLFSEGYLAI